MLFLFFFIIYLFLIFLFFFFNDTATTEIYTLSLHDALPPSPASSSVPPCRGCLSARGRQRPRGPPWRRDRKSTRLNSSHTVISYAVFCLKKKKKKKTQQHTKKKKKKKKKYNNTTKTK